MVYGSQRTHCAERQSPGLAGAGAAAASCFLVNDADAAGKQQAESFLFGSCVSVTIFSAGRLYVAAVEMVNRSAGHQQFFSPRRISVASILTVCTMQRRLLT